MVNITSSSMIIQEVHWTIFSMLEINEKCEACLTSSFITKCIWALVQVGGPPMTTACQICNQWWDAAKQNRSAL